jgi:hypothetical protein
MVKKSKSRNEHRAWRGPLQAAAARESHLTWGSLGTLEHCRIFSNLPRHRLQMLRNVGTANHSVKIMLASLAASCLDTVDRVVGREYGK